MFKVFLFATGVFATEITGYTHHADMRQDGGSSKRIFFKAASMATEQDCANFCDSYKGCVSFEITATGDCKGFLEDAKKAETGSNYFVRDKGPLTKPAEFKSCANCTGDAPETIPAGYALFDNFKIDKAGSPKAEFKIGKDKKGFTPETCAALCEAYDKCFAFVYVTTGDWAGACNGWEDFEWGDNFEAGKTGHATYFRKAGMVTDPKCAPPGTSMAALKPPCAGGTFSGAGSTTVGASTIMLVLFSSAFF